MKSRICCLLAVFLLLVSVVSCAPAALHQEGTHYVHEQTGISYCFAPSYYTAHASGEAIARLLHKVAGEELLYAIGALSTEEYLVTDAGRLLCAEGIVLPDLAMLPVSDAKLFSFSLNMATAAIVTDPEKLTELKRNCSEGAFFDANRIALSITRDSYELCFFATGEYTGLLYSLQYWHCDEHVLIYEEFENDNAANQRYPGILYTLVEEEGIVYARYDFGCYLIYDPVSGTCRMAGDVFATEVSG